MIFIDTSAWIEFLRNTGSPVCTLVDELLDSEIAICDTVRMEVLAGARAVSAAYGWPADLTDGEIVARLLRLNMGREAVG